MFSEILAEPPAAISGAAEVESVLHPKNSDSSLADCLLAVGVATRQFEVLLYT